MTHTLISILGRPPRTQGGSYRPTTYVFESTTGTESVSTVFFGQALHQWLCKQGSAPDRLVILGTTGSIWDHLIEHLNWEGHEETWYALNQSAQASSVTQAQLDAVVPQLRDALGYEVQLVLIPHCKSRDEQVELLRIIASMVNENDQVTLDITHGFRHLPMIALMSALHLRATRNAHIQGIYYGSFDPDTGQAPVFDLRGLLTIADWVSALTTFDKDGDYGVFAHLMEGPGDDMAQKLLMSAFQERTHQIGRAKNTLRQVAATLRQHPLENIGALFQPTLENRLAWTRGDNLYRRQRELAWEYLQRRDYLRATILGYEGFVTRLVTDPSKRDDYPYRDEARKHYEQTQRHAPEFDAYRELQNLRNYLAHGATIQEAPALDNEATLREKLQQLITTLLPPES